MKKLHISMAGKRAVNGYLFILPWLLGFLLFYVRSLYMTVEFSLSDLTVLSTGGYNLEFVGLKNYYEAFFSHASFKQTLTTSIGNMLIDVPLHYCPGCTQVGCREMGRLVTEHLKKG